MSSLTKLLLGNGRLRPELKAAPEVEGLVLVEEGLKGSVRYHHFKAPGKRLHGTIRAERIGLGISERRFVMYCRSGRVKLADSAFDNPRLGMVDVSLDDKGRVALRIDYDKQDDPKVAGQITIVVRPADAPRVVDELRIRIMG